MSRETCYRCFWPKALCWCASIQPMPTTTKFIFLMHPKEYKEEKAATGRLTHLCLEGSELHVGVGFDDHEPVQALLNDPGLYPMLVYPGTGAVNLSTDPLPSEALVGRRLAVILLDATWALGRKMLRLSPSLQRLPKLMFTPSAPSRYVIKQQPHPSCLSTLEATHELLQVLERSGMDRYPLPEQLLSIFDRMQRYQMQCASDPGRSGYRRRAYSPPTERKPASGRSGARRTKLFPKQGLPADSGTAA